MVKALLARTALFRGATHAQLARLAAVCSVVDFARGQLVYARGKRLRGVHAVASGMLKLSLHHGTPHERVLRLVQAGQTCGEPAALLDRPARCDARTLAASRLVVVPADAVYALVEQD